MNHLRGKRHETPVATPKADLHLKKIMLCGMTESHTTEHDTVHDIVRAKKSTSCSKVFRLKTSSSTGIFKLLEKGKDCGSEMASDVEWAQCSKTGARRPLPARSLLPTRPPPENVEFASNLHRYNVEPSQMRTKRKLCKPTYLGNYFSFV
ncbi:hypothetical protein CEXT_595681 [Caerostris extrusa]|uniref:Uncharacterized protein n=1 Tax=Caerostris extrusa TaxID=172846 RepID=A0AAV4Y1T0_CAEEX|nr:hypothetical protein CEXT_595681 [Caerostris extrusa]